MSVCLLVSRSFCHNLLEALIGALLINVCEFLITDQKKITFELRILYYNNYEITTFETPCIYCDHVYVYNIAQR